MICALVVVVMSTVATASPTAAGIDKLLANWEQRFKLMEIG